MTDIKPWDAGWSFSRGSGRSMLWVFYIKDAGYLPWVGGMPVSDKFLPTLEEAKLRVEAVAALEGEETS